MQDWLVSKDQGCVLHLFVQPGASKTEVVGPHGEGRFKIRLRARPIENQANEELLSFLKKKLRVKGSDLEIVRGTLSRSKDVFCRTRSPIEVRSLLV